jgi:hypothetical protein
MMALAPGTVEAELGAPSFLASRCGHVMVLTHNARVAYAGAG